MANARFLRYDSGHMDKRFLLILGAVVILFGGIFWFTKSKSSNNAQNANTQTSGSNHVIGANTAGVAIVEYGDFQCPACGQYFPILQQIKQQYGDQISFQFAHFPLVQIHQNAMAAARAAEAAAKQNKFWEMHDLLYTNQNSWSETPNPTPYFEGYAKQLNLDLDQFRKDQASQAVGDTINADVVKVKALGGNSTPTFVINGKKVEKNPGSYEEFVKLIDELIAQNKQQ